MMALRSGRCTDRLLPQDTADSACHFPSPLRVSFFTHALDQGTSTRQFVTFHTSLLKIEFQHSHVFKGRSIKPSPVAQSHMLQMLLLPLLLLRLQAVDMQLTRLTLGLVHLCSRRANLL